MIDFDKDKITEFRVEFKWMIDWDRAPDAESFGKMEEFILAFLAEQREQFRDELEKLAGPEGSGVEGESRSLMCSDDPGYRELRELIKKLI